jgi:hypothetical protein
MSKSGQGKFAMQGKEDAQCKETQMRNARQGRCALQDRADALSKAVQMR